MKRYLTDIGTLSEKLCAEPYVYDAIVIGSGLAGLYCALNLSSKLEVALVCAAGIENSSSYLAQGGIAAVIEKTDSYEAHFDDTMAAGANICDEDTVQVLVSQGPSDIAALEKLGVPFDRTQDGALRTTREGGHTHRRIVHCGGDATGREATKTLYERACEKENVHRIDSYLVDILTNDEKAYGIITVNEKGEHSVLFSNHIVVATGGAGQVYKYSTTPEGNIGEGIAACVRAGAKTADLEFVQFHPTALCAKNKDGERLFLISEAVRGEGAVLVNSKGEHFMAGLHPMADLAPRDIVARAIFAQMQKNGEDKVFLDVSCMSEEFFKKRFPTICKTCEERGIFPPKDKIPVCPTQHYIMGGVKTDLDAKTNIDGLYVCGEAACTGLHGANRLASNSTIECLVFARRAAEYINSHVGEYVPASFPLTLQEYARAQYSDKEYKEDFMRLKELMTSYVGVVRRQSELALAKTELEKLYKKYEDAEMCRHEQYALLNAITVARLITDGAINRKKSIGAHFLAE